MIALLSRVRRDSVTLVLDALGLAAVAVGVGMWILPLGVVVGGAAALVMSRIVDPTPRPSTPRDRP